MACPHVSGAAALLLENNPSMDSSAVMTQLTNNARKDFIADLWGDDTNLFLFVGEGGAPPTPPTPPPPPTAPPPKCPFFAIREETDIHGDCQCRNGLFCSGWCQSQLADLDRTRRMG